MTHTDKSKCLSCGVPKYLHGTTCCGWANSNTIINPSNDEEVYYQSLQKKAGNYVNVANTPMNTDKQYEKSGCNECVHAESTYDWVNGKYSVISRNCKIGKTILLNKWWENNGHKKRGEEQFDIMDCHEWHEATKLLIDANRTASELLTLIKTNNP